MKDKYKIFSVLCLMLITVITGCDKENKNEPEVTLTPEVTTTPTPEPTPTPVEDRYVDLTEEEINKVLGPETLKQYEGKNETEYTTSLNRVTCYIISYYKYIGLDDFILPVAVNYTVSEAEELFGGEWDELEGVTVPFFSMHYNRIDENRNYDIWLKGELTVSQIENALLYGEDDRVFVLNDPSVEKHETYPAPPIEPFSDYMEWLRYWGDLHMIYEDNGNLIYLDNTIQYLYYF